MTLCWDSVVLTFWRIWWSGWWVLCRTVSKFTCPSCAYLVDHPISYFIFNEFKLVWCVLCTEQSEMKTKSYMSLTCMTSWSSSYFLFHLQWAETRMPFITLCFIIFFLVFWFPVRSSLIVTCWWQYVTFPVGLIKNSLQVYL